MFLIEKKHNTEPCIAPHLNSESRDIYLCLPKLSICGINVRPNISVQAENYFSSTYVLKWNIGSGRQTAFSQSAFLHQLKASESLGKLTLERGSHPGCKNFSIKTSRYLCIIGILGMREEILIYEGKFFLKQSSFTHSLTHLLPSSPS